MSTCRTSQENGTTIKLLDLIKYAYFFIIIAVTAKPWDEGSGFSKTRKLWANSVGDYHY